MFAKRGIKDANQLDPEEKATFETWQAVLSKEELTMDDVKQFCRSQLDVIEGKWTDLNLEQSKKAEFIPYHTVYKSLLAAIDSPKAAREALEKQLIELTK
jgi:hypothetical protein